MHNSCGVRDKMTCGLTCGVKVDVVRGKYKGDRGVVRKVSGKMCVVELSRAKECVRVLQDSVQVVDDLSGVFPMERQISGNVEHEGRTASGLKRAAVRKVFERELREIQARVDELIILLEQL